MAAKKPKLQKTKLKKPNLEEQVRELSKQEIKELLLINTYKLALVRGQMEVITEILVKNKLATREEIWKKTMENFKDSSI